MEKICVEMVFSSLYHYSRARERGDSSTAVEYLVAQAKLLGLVKAERKRHKEHLNQTIETWGRPYVDSKGQALPLHRNSL